VSQTGHYTFGGRVEAKFKAFALNDDELKLLEDELKRQDFYDALKLASITTEESLAQLADDMNHFLTEAPKEGGKGQSMIEFLFGKGGKKIKSEEEAKKEKEKKEKEMKKLTLETLRKDNFEESVVRIYAEQQAAGSCFKVYDIYKKGHGMASFAEPTWEYAKG